MSDVIAMNKFGGEVPVSPPHLLPQWGAQQALFCDFTHGHLMPMKQGLLLTTMSQAVKAIYTEDGISFYTWPNETYVVKSPVLTDLYNRVYFLDSGGVLRATTTAGMAPTGGQPSISWRVGVPQPTLAPGLVIVERTTLRDYPGATCSVSVWWEYNSERFQQTTPTLTTVTAFRKFTFNAPAIDATNTPADAVLRATFQMLDASGDAFLTATMTVGDTDTRSDALPGNVTFALTSAGTALTLALTYGISETRAYTYSCVNTWLEESAPGPANTIDVTYMEDVAVTLGAVDFVAGGYRPLLHYTTYRTMGTNASYLDIHEDTALTFTDTSSKGSDVLGALETADYMAPPAQLTAMIALSTGVLIGFFGNMLYMSEPYRPHTWQYQLSFRKAVRSVCEQPQAIVLTTAEGCYIVVGSSPSAMQPIPLPLPEAGIAQRSIVELDGRTAFASNDGIVSVMGSNASMDASQLLFARDDWQTRYGAILADASLRFGYQDGCLVGSSSSQALGFVIRLDEDASGQYTQFNEQMDSMFRLPVADALYYSKGANIYQFRAGAPYGYTWWSRETTFATQRNLGAGFIRCSAPVTLTVYMDGAQWFTGTVSTGYFRLPPGQKGRRWSFKMQGTATVEEVYFGRTIQEVQEAIARLNNV